MCSNSLNQFAPAERAIHIKVDQPVDWTFVLCIHNKRTLSQNSFIYNLEEALNCPELRFIGAGVLGPESQFSKIDYKATASKRHNHARCLKQIISAMSPYWSESGLTDGSNNDVFELPEKLSFFNDRPL